MALHFFLDRFLGVCYKVYKTKPSRPSKPQKIMRRARQFLRKAFTPITIMIVPHSKSKLLRLRIPLTLLVAVPVLWGFGMFYVVSVGVQAAKYSEMSRKLSYFSSEFLEMRSTLSSLQTADGEFRRLFSLKSKKKVLEAVSTNETGTPDLELLKKQVAEAMASVAEIRRYIKEERDTYFALKGIAGFVLGRFLSGENSTG